MSESESYPLMRKLLVGELQRCVVESLQQAGGASKKTKRKGEVSMGMNRVETKAIMLTVLILNSATSTGRKR